jgi:hypothetical protein
MNSPYASDPKDVELEAVVAREVRPFCANAHVSVRGGHVTLSGVAQDYDDKRDALNAARHVAGVHEVTNYIRVAQTD